MKKLFVFIILSCCYSFVFADFDTNVKFCRRNFQAKIKDSLHNRDLVHFNQAIKGSPRLNRLYEYFENEMSKSYADGLESSRLRIFECMNNITYNVEIVLDEFKRQAKVNGIIIEVIKQNEIVTIPVKKVKPVVARKEPNIEVFVEPLDNPVPVKINLVAPAETVPTVPVDNSDDNILRRLQAIKGEDSFEDRFKEAILNAPRIYSDPSASLELMLLSLTGKIKYNDMTFKDILHIKNELDAYLDIRINPLPKVETLSWFYRKLANSRFAWAIELSHKKLSSMRVAKNDKRYVSVALNIKLIALKKIYTEFKRRNNHYAYIKLIKEYKETLALTIELS